MDVVAEKFIEFANTPWAGIFLSIHAFMESSFLPGAHDIFLVAVSVARPEMCFVFAIFSTIGSVCGGMFGYALGRFGGRPLFNRMVPGKFTERVEALFDKYGMWAVAIAGFTPLPYKVFAITGGVFKIDFRKFVFVSLIARAMRFFLVSTILYLIGPQIKEYIVHSFNVFSIVCIIMVILYVMAMRSFKKKEASEG